jgi:hypothetical protein
MALLLFGSSPVGHSATFKVVIKGYVVCVQTNKYFQMDPLYHASGYEYAMHDGARVILWEYDFCKFGNENSAQIWKNTNKFLKIKQGI